MWSGPSPGPSGAPTSGAAMEAAATAAVEGSGVNASAGSQLEDTLALWNAKGAPEFIPGGTESGPQNGPRGHVGPGVAISGSSQAPGMPVPHMMSGGTLGPAGHPGPAYPGMSGPMPQRWGGPMSMPGHWPQMPNGDAAWQAGRAGPNGAPVFAAMRNGTLPHGSGQPASDRSPQMAPKTLVVVWNLNPAYKDQDLQQDLLEIDFTPEKLQACTDVAGVYVLWYDEVWLADALVISIDGTHDHLKNNGEPLRLCKWNPDLAEGDTGEIPDHIRSAVASMI